MGNSQFASGKKSIGFCDRCGRKVPYKELKPQVVNQIITDIRVCNPCMDKDHPQWRIGRVRITDPQALRNTRPDPNLVLSRDIQWGWNPVGFNNNNPLFEPATTPNNLLAIGEIGNLTVVTS